MGLNRASRLFEWAKSPLLQTIDCSLLQHRWATDHLHRFDLACRADLEIENHGALYPCGLCNRRVDGKGLMFDMLLNRLRIDLQQILCPNE